MLSKIAIPEDEYFRAIFPEEIWELILDEMMKISLEDVERLRAIFPFFRRILQRKRVQMLFPQVLNIMAENGYLVPKPGTWINHVEYGHFPIIQEQTDNRCNIIRNFGSAKFPHILKLRLVCKMWKKAVDSFYQDKLYHGKFIGVSHERCFAEYFRTARTFPGNCIPSFLSHYNELSLRNPAYNPFLTKTCTFSFSMYYSDQQQQYLNNISSLLKKYGHCLEKCTFDFLNVEECWIYLNKLLEWLELLPNLRKLKIELWQYLPSEPQDILIMENAFAWKPLSRMEKLEHLILTKVDARLGARILAANNHITRLDLTYSDNPMGRVVINQLPNLAHLTVSVYDNDQFDHFRTSTFTSSLKTLELLLFFVKYPPSHVFETVQNIGGETLENLSMIIIRKANTTSSQLKAEIQKDCEQLQKIYLPNLAMFQMDVEESYGFLHSISRRLDYLPEYDEHNVWPQGKLKLILLLLVWLVLVVLLLIHLYLFYNTF